MTVLKSVFLGKNWRSKPFVFSLIPRSHDEYGCAKKVSALRKTKKDRRCKRRGKLSSLIVVSCKRDRWPRNADKNVKVLFDDQYQPVSRGILLEAGRVNRLSINSTTFEVRVSR